MNWIKDFFYNISAIYWVLILVVVFSFVGILFSYLSINELDQENERQKEQITALKSSLASTTALLIENIRETETEFANALQKEKENLESKFGNVENKVGEISGTVGNLEKLSKTDEELLQKYSKVYFLNEHYVPTRLSDIKDKYKYYEDRDLEILHQVKPYLENMLEAALQDGVEIYVMSSYRSFDTQSTLNDYYSVTYGEGTANQFSADQGYSEHQLGTTVDLITTGIEGTLEGFGDTLAFQWLQNNAYKYGFTLSYPENNQYYIYEPWHWRFVGKELATYLHNNDMDFYDLDQRKINEYLLNIFD